jgi:NAD(P)H-hydrate epimerase
VIPLPSVSATDLPAVTAGEMRQIDRLAVEDFGIGLAQMMELAGASLARLAAQTMHGTTGKRVTLLGGPGSNGGGGLVAARHLANRGAEIHVVLAQPVGRLHLAAKERLLTLIEMHVPCCVAAWDLAEGELEALLANSDLLIDALLGYSADGPPRGPVRELVEQAIRSNTSVLSLDLPSGIDPDTGAIDGAALRAVATMTVALPKRGLLSSSGRKYIGDLYLADIGLPAALYSRAGLSFADPFLGGSLVRLDWPA